MIFTKITAGKRDPSMPLVGGPSGWSGANARTRSNGHAKSKKPVGVLVRAVYAGVTTRAHVLARTRGTNRKRQLFLDLRKNPLDSLAKVG